MPPSFGAKTGLGVEATRLRQIALVVGDIKEARRILVCCFLLYVIWVEVRLWCWLVGGEIWGEEPGNLVLQWVILDTHSSSAELV
jgi:hypothetical protein